MMIGKNIFYNRTVDELKNLRNNNLIFQILNNPNVYFMKLFVNTVFIGIFTFVLSFIYVNTGLHETKIPSSMHSLIGIVIGLLLVFRTNTAYDRWWDGRKNISSLASSVSFFVIKFQSSVLNGDGTFVGRLKKEESETEIFLELRRFLDQLKSYLKHSSDGSPSAFFHKSQMSSVKTIMQHLALLRREGYLIDRDVASLEGSLGEMLDSSNACERIKNTPIPVAYAMHIKVSILIYLMTLPFGLFYDLGMWATPIVMLIYYMIAGIEIISNEIENPFAGDPNDLPVEELINNIIDTMN